MAYTLITIKETALNRLLFLLRHKKSVPKGRFFIFYKIYPIAILHICLLRVRVNICPSLDPAYRTHIDNSYNNWSLAMTGPEYQVINTPDKFDLGAFNTETDDGINVALLPVVGLI